MLTEIVGANHYPSLVFLNDSLSLKREPNNHYDPNAIAVFKKDTKVGYIPRSVAKDMAPSLDKGDLYKVYVVSIGNGFIIPIKVVKFFSSE